MGLRRDRTGEDLPFKEGSLEKISWNRDIATFTLKESGDKKFIFYSQVRLNNGERIRAYIRHYSSIHNMVVGIEVLHDGQMPTRIIGSYKEESYNWS